MNKLISLGIIILVIVGCNPMAVRQSQKNLQHYEFNVEQCATIEAGEYLTPDVATLYWESLNDDQSLFHNSDFTNSFIWFMDKIEKYCTHHSLENPTFAMAELNDILASADEEYFQYQKQARIGIQSNNMELIKSAFSHRQKAWEYIDESAHYYHNLVERYE